MKAYAALKNQLRDYTHARKTWGPVGLELAWRVEVERWPGLMREAWEERSAIIEYDGGLPRSEAERRAYEIVRSASDAERLMKKGRRE